LQCWSEAFFYLFKFLLLSLVFAYIYILQGSVEAYLSRGGIYNDYIIANCLQSVPVKKIGICSIIDENIDKSKEARLWPRCILQKEREKEYTVIQCLYFRQLLSKFQFFLQAHFADSVCTA